MKYYIYYLSLTFILSAQAIFSQPRIEFNNQNIFLSGSNVAWVSFARDIGPGNTNLARFNEIFAELKAAGGNSMRFWLHTDGTASPEFDGTGLVIGPGAGAITDLLQIMDLAWQNEIGLMLCLWSHDMMVTSKPANILDRNERLLTDTTALREYINNALIPMVEALKGHPALLAWEIFNEPEGFTEIGNWGDRRHVTEFDVQRCCNLMAGAIHRTDPNAKVTNGTWGLQALTDIATVAKISPDAFYNSLTSAQRLQIELEFKTKYGINYTAKEIIGKFYSVAANSNYYRDDRLIAAGHDPDGTLDFYTVHYYSWAGTALSPFHHPYSYWNLDKPLVIAEFFMEDGLGISYRNLYQQLYNTGYAGALSWQWWGDTQANDNAKNNNHTRTVEAMQDMLFTHPNDIVVNPKTGTIYTFQISADTIELGESVKIKWITSTGSTPKLNGVNVAESDSLEIFPDSTTEFKLVTNNQVADTEVVKVNVLFPGTILAFSVFPHQAAKGEKISIKWQTVSNSTVKLNNNSVNEDDSIQVTIDSTTTYTLIGGGMLSDTSTATVTVLPVDQVNRALERYVTSSSGTNPQNVNDGKFSTFWNSSNAQNQWIHVSLEGNYVVSRAVIKWGTTYARSYRVVNFTHPVNYIVLSQKTNGTGGIDTVALNDTLRNLRVYLDQSSGQGYAIRELEIYGVPSNVTDTGDLPFIAEDYRLFQNYPNPFNPASKIVYQIPASGFVKLKIYDILGNEIETLVNDYKASGKYEVTFDGSGLASGVYIYTLTANDFISSRKMVILK